MSCGWAGENRKEESDAKLEEEDKSFEISSEDEDDDADKADSTLPVAGWAIYLFTYLFLCFFIVEQQIMCL